MTKIQKDLSRGLYSSFFREKPTYRKLLFLADFLENRAPFIKNSILTIFTDPKAKSWQVVRSIDTQGLHVFISNLYIKSVTCVKTTPVAETIIEFYEIARFENKTIPFV